MVLLTQYFDTLKEVAGTNRSNTILMPHTPNALAELMEQFRTTLITGELATQGPNGAPAAISAAVPRS